jgi:sugar phosphate isomerase/epimerase
MIFTSTGGQKKISAVQYAKRLLSIGLKNIELSGGAFSESYEAEIESIYPHANLRIHNYFPPPKNPFVFNLASTDKHIKKISHTHVENAIRIAAKYGEKIYSFHAGFRVNPKVEELGGELRRYKLLDRNSALEVFGESIADLSHYAKQHDVMLLIENNVIGSTNFKVYQEDPLLLTSPDEISNFMNNVPSNVGLLVDLAHLYVSSVTLGFNAVKAHNQISQWVHAYHLSENNGLEDLNWPVEEESWFWNCIRRDLDYYSLEVYGVSEVALSSQVNLVENKLLTV